jgi:hypothetical protein
MWKLVVGFILFAAVALYVISKAGDKVDMGGEKHGVEAAHVPGIDPHPRRQTAQPQDLAPRCPARPRIFDLRTGDLD